MKEDRVDDFDLMKIVLYHVTLLSGARTGFNDDIYEFKAALSVVYESSLTNRINMRMIIIQRAELT